MPSKSKAQQHFFGMELAKKRAGKKTQTGLAEATIEDFAATKTTNLPQQVKKGKKNG